MGHWVPKAQLLYSLSKPGVFCGTVSWITNIQTCHNLCGTIWPCMICGIRLLLSKCFTHPSQTRKFHHEGSLAVDASDWNWTLLHEYAKHVLYPWITSLTQRIYILAKKSFFLSKSKRASKPHVSLSNSIITCLIFSKRDDILIVIIDKSRKHTSLPCPHAYLSILPFLRYSVLLQGH